MTPIRVAFYARVSGEQQAAAHTVESQIAALIRPALDRLRDLVNVGAIDRIYVHSPDRLARN